MKALLTKLLCGVAILLLAPASVLAQDGTISGTVTDGQTGDPLPGATVQVQELGIGSATDIDGNYELSVPEGEHVVTASFVGYNPTEKTVTVTAGETTNADFALAPKTEELDEIVVTALGIEEEERSLGYAVSDVGGEEIAESTEQDVAQALIGKVPGLQINNSSGQPGSATRIVIRGANSYDDNNQPLIVVDGQPISNDSDDNPRGPSVFTGGTANRLLDIDPNSIADVNVLKGAAATALYGSRAANGAIIITTKGGQGTSGFRATFTSSFGFSDPIIEGWQGEYLQGANGCFENGLPIGRGAYTEENDPNSPDCLENDPASAQTFFSFGPRRGEESQAVLDSLGRIETFDPRDQFWRRGTQIENSLTLSGTNDFGNASVTISDSRNEGIVPTTENNRTSVQAKFQSDLSEQITLQASTQYSENRQQYDLEGQGTSSYTWGLRFAPISFDLKPTTFDDGTERDYGNANPFFQVENAAQFSDVTRLIGSARLSYQPLEWLTIQEQVGVDTYTDKRKEENAPLTGASPQGSTFDQNIRRTEINSDFTVTAKRGITEDLSINFLVGNNINRRQTSFVFVQGNDINVLDFYNISNFTSQNRTQFTSDQVLIGAYSRASLNYRDYAYLQLSARNDWSSTLPLDNNSYFYPSANASFVFTEAFSDVFDDTFLSFGKIRASLAQVGSDTDPYELQTVFLQAEPGDGVRGEIFFPYNGVAGYQQSFQGGNPNLKPEISTAFEIGTDLRFFNQRATLDVSYYRRTTKDQIFPVPTSGATGFTQRIQNAGKIQNRGIELLASGTPVQVGDFNWDLTVNWTRSRTEVLELAEGVPNIFLFGFVSPQIRAEVGNRGYGVIYGNQFLRNGMISEDQTAIIAGQERTSPLPGVSDDAVIIGSDGLPIAADSPGVIGNVQPDWTGGIRSTFSFKGVALTQQWDIQQGGDILNFDRGLTELTGDHINTESRGNTTVFDGINADTGEQNAVEVTRDESFFGSRITNIDEYLVEDASYVKLREVTLSYRFGVPENLSSRAGLKNVRLALTGRNLLTFSDFTNGDPTTGQLAGSGNGQGFYSGITPGTRQYRVSLTLGF